MKAASCNGCSKVSRPRTEVQRTEIREDRGQIGLRRKRRRGRKTKRSGSEDRDLRRQRTDWLAAQAPERT
ncbi:MAG: hypothetical protein LBD06_03895 [Candidatus Accumulibacter sp.]|nr:hypothetical protein [Accumulibacter sp.]